MVKRQPPSPRPKNPKPIRLTERDHYILETLHAFDGMMSRRQLDRLFFSGQGRTQARQRLFALFSHGYLDRPTAAEVHRVPLGEHIYWLDNKGAEVVAGLQGLSLSAFAWRKKQSLAQVEHDLSVNNFRIDVNLACRRSPLLSLGNWISEAMFRAEPDTAVYQDETGKERTRQVIPDGFFTVQRQAQQRPDKVEEFAFLLEVDMATHTNARFAREKVRAGVAYLHSPAYRKRFALDYGRWLVVTTGERRLWHLKHVTERAGGNGLFYFTTFPQLSTATVLAAPIWQVAGESEQVAIIPEAQVISYT